MKIPNTISLRLTLWYTLLVFLALVCFGWLILWITANETYDQQRSMLKEKTIPIAEHLDVDRGKFDKEHIEEKEQELRLHEYGIFFEVWDDHSLLFRSRNFPLELELPLPAKSDLPDIVKAENDYRYQILTEPISIYESGSKKSFPFFLRLGRSDLYVERILDRIRVLSLFLIPIAVAIAAFSGWILARRALRPVDEITRTAQNISVHSLDQRLPEPRYDDELGRLSKTFNALLERIQIGVEKIQRFSADASHELRTPLTVLHGEMEVALRKERSPKEYQTVLNSALQEIGWMEKIVNNLLTLSRADSGQATLEIQNADLTQLLKDSIEMNSNAAEAKKIKMHLNAKSMHGRVDPDRIRQLFINLLDNAIKYSPKDREIKMELKRLDDEAVIVFQDQGIGIPPQDLPYVFERFYRADKSRSRELHGSGLGLSICQWIVNAHHGTLEIDSEPEKGTTVTIRLPLDQEKS